MKTVKIQVFHNKQSDFSSITTREQNPGAYETVAEIELPDLTNTLEGIQVMLDEAYKLTNNITGSWSAKEEWRNMSPGYDNVDDAACLNVKAPLHESNGKVYGIRSTSIGDAIQIKDNTYYVSPVGFKVFIESEGISALVNPFTKLDEEKSITINNGWLKIRDSFIDGSYKDELVRNSDIKLDI